MWVVASILITTLLSLYSIYKRHQVESANKAVSLTAEFENIEALASAEGIPIDKAFAQLKAQGLNSVVLSESFLSELTTTGRVTMSTAGTPPVTSLTFVNPEDLIRVQRAMRIRYHDLAGRLVPRGNVLVLPPVAPDILRQTSIGLDPVQAAEAKKAGLSVIARFSNPFGVSAQTVGETLAWAKELGTTVFLPQGDQVLGRREALGAMIEALKLDNILYASPEFTKLGGDEDVLEKAPELVIRLHSAQVAELDRLSPADAVDRYAKAARERNMRILLIRPLTLGADQPFQSFTEFFKQINTQVRNEGGAIAEPHPFKDSNLPKALLVLIALSIVPAAFFVCTSFVQKKLVLQIVLGLLTLLALASVTRTGLHLIALVGSMTYPIVGFLALDDFADGSRKPTLANILLGYVIVSLISIVGGLVVAGLLNELKFFVKADEFKAVKLSVFLPILVVGAYFFWKLTDWRQSLKSPITWGAAALGLVILTTLGLMLARTGNDSGVGASGGEMLLRNLLDRYLYVRPRTKEFMFGHPILVIAIGMLLWIRARFAPVTSEEGPGPWAGWVALLVMLGAIGETSVVNTMCHLHIPVMLSIARAFEGLALGCIIGVVLWVPASRLLPKAEA